MPHFICVRFQVDGRIVVVHESWLVGEAHCRWPQSGNIEEMVKSATKPKSEWGVWETDILGGDDDYETCARRAYSTQQSWGLHHKVGGSGGGGYVPDKDLIAAIPVPTSLTPQPVQANIRNSHEVARETPPTTTTPTTTTTAKKRKAPNENAEVKATLDRLEESISTINKNISLRLKNIEDKLKPILQAELLSSGSKTPEFEEEEEQDEEEDDAETRNLTVLSAATTLEQLNEWLDNQDTFAVSKKVTCTHLRATVRKFVKACMTKSVARQFSWTGFGSRRLKTKISFRDHKVFNYLLDVLHDTPHRHASRAEIADSIKKVLTGVGDWDGGRTARFSSFPSIAFFP
ncbi:uncharacterized protein LOC120337622 isoform X2 [Styela clava]|uniref:uncharacterized protein LOC120337622 isoform X2 n=1 Tax=Styela clava TaxID=7725 RepID=UPI001939A9DF|nr:uncharacterized protein LOC120337622 isoform X2 [Styela clava]